MSDCPCHKDGKGCTKRFPGCHAKCKDYDVWAQNLKAKNENIRAQRADEKMFNDYLFKKVHKLKQRKGLR